MPPRKRKSTDNVDQAQSKKAKVSGGKADPAKLQSMPHVGKLSEWLLDLNTGYHFSAWEKHSLSGAHFALFVLTIQL